jgi:outer membrane receptor protein involved in Fe transport
MVGRSFAAPQGDQTTGEPLKQLSLADLGNVEVTTASKEPEEVWKTPAAVFVITQDDIRRSGATSIPEVLRLAPGVEVAQVDSDHWSVSVSGRQNRTAGERTAPKAKLVLRTSILISQTSTVILPILGGGYLQRTGRRETGM